MDKQGRLTRVCEWRIGATYRWKKGNYLGKEVLCVAILPGKIILSSFNDGLHDVTYYPDQWRHRFMLSPS